MRQIADFHIHSKYSRACSRDLTLSNIDQACRIKGVDIIGTGDFTFPDWFKAISEDLEEIQGRRDSRISPTGLYKLKTADDDKVKFILSTELALIYKKGDRARRIHIVIHAPDLKAVEELNGYLDKHYNIRSDGRPILGMSSEELVKLCLSIHPKFLIYPAHIWTPWFSVYGSKSGFDSFEECFGEYTKDIHAFETGLSSDVEMNWRVSALDKLTLLSNSDAHSLPNIAREANVFWLEDINYSEIYEIVKNKLSGVILDSRWRGNDDNDVGLMYTIEFFPEEGMYHFDGHRDCGIRLSPAESKRQKGICPVCKKPLTIGVMNRVEELADRPAFAEATTGKPARFKLPGAPGFIKLVELDKIIAEALNIKNRHSVKVQSEYRSLIKKGGSELAILIDTPIEKIQSLTSPEIASGIARVRQGELSIEPGYDGEYGHVKIFDGEKKRDKQTTLF